MLPLKKKLLTGFLTISFTVISFQTCFAYTPQLKMYMRNNDVYQLQSSLKKLGFMNSNPTGYFGTKTKSTVVKFQKTYGISAIGIAGPKTQAKITSLLNQASKPKSAASTSTVSTTKTNSANTISMASNTSRGNDDFFYSVFGTSVIKKWIPGLPQIPYRKGAGAYEGVVLHFTANYNDTAETEARYELFNWRKAFVHEFVDPTMCIQVSNPNYLCWGAGTYANQRFVQIELCHADNQRDLNASFQMYTERAAEYLYARKLGVTPAKPNGTGTLWSHRDVTYYLGGSTHTDPIEYLAYWGKSWNDVINSVTKYYNMFAAKDKQ